MEENAAEASPKFSLKRFEPVAGVAHTVFLLLVLAAVAAVG